MTENDVDIKTKAITTWTWSQNAWYAVKLQADNWPQKDMTVNLSLYTITEHLFPKKNKKLRNTSKYLMMLVIELNSKSFMNNYN